MALQERADCPKNYELIDSWLSKCKSHRLCAKSAEFLDDLKLPTRLIDVGEAGDGSDAKLVETSNIADHASIRYVALTHCWGDPNRIPKTTQNTIDDHYIKLPELSKTFRDAVKVVKQLNIHYIWIDSLCIIQDVKADFHKECALMHHVYAGAYLTISALGAESGDIGLFIPRSLHKAKPVLFWDTALCGPLMSRGWALQEQQLSPRLIHFAQERIIWECRTTVAFEDQPYMTHRSTAALSWAIGSSGGAPDRYMSWRIFDRSDGSNALKSFQTVHAKRDDVFTRWLRLVEGYSERKFTYADDKQFALQGISSAISRMTDSTLVSGLWCKDLFRGLLWTPAPMVQKRFTEESASFSFQKLPLAPSWSWLSHDGPVRFRGAVADRFAEFFTSRTNDWLGSKPPHIKLGSSASAAKLDGDIQYPILHINALCTRIFASGSQVTLQHPSRPSTKLDARTAIIKTLQATDAGSSGGKQNTSELRTIEIKTGPYVYRSFPYDAVLYLERGFGDSESIFEGLICLLSVTSVPSKDEISLMTEPGLVLKPVQDGRYERVGLCQICVAYSPHEKALAVLERLAVEVI